MVLALCCGRIGSLQRLSVKVRNPRAFDLAPLLDQRTSLKTVRLGPVVIWASLAVSPTFCRNAPELFDGLRSSRGWQKMVRVAPAGAVRVLLLDDVEQNGRTHASLVGRSKSRAHLCPTIFESRR
jgi:hypothetical protein